MTLWLWKALSTYIYIFMYLLIYIIYLWYYMYDTINQGSNLSIISTNVNVVNSCTKWKCHISTQIKIQFYDVQKKQSDSEMLKLKEW